MHTLEEVHRGLSHLRQSTYDDIFPIVREDNPNGGYLGVPRAVLSYVDYLGALYSGYGGETRGRHRLIATTQKAENFIVDVLGKVNPAYKKHGPLLYRMYRHGTVHLFRPNMLQRQDGHTIEFLLYKCDRTHNIDFYEGKQNFPVKHVVPQHWERTRHILPVSISVLYHDLGTAIDWYYGMIKAEVSIGTTTLLKNYSDVIEALLLPDPTDLTW